MNSSVIRHSVVVVVLLMLSSIAAVLVAFTTNLSRFSPKINQTPTQAVRIVVLPHHDLLGREYEYFYEQLFSKQHQFQTIYLLAPNHFESESRQIKTNETAKDTIAVEYAVQLHLPFLKQYFPKVTIHPVLLTRAVPQQSLDALIEALRQQDQRSMLLVISTDFSHNQTRTTADYKDTRTLEAILHRNQEEILAMDDSYLDCPACLYVALGVASESARPNVFYHGNSADYLSLASTEPTTSYFVLSWD